MALSVIYLRVKGIELKLVGALERLRVDLLKSDPVELALEDVDLLNVVVRAPDVVAFPGQRQLRVFCALRGMCTSQMLECTLVASFFSVLSKTRKGIQSLCTSSRESAFCDLVFFRFRYLMR